MLKLRPILLLGIMDTMAMDIMAILMDMLDTMDMGAETTLVLWFPVLANKMCSLLLGNKDQSHYQYVKIISNSKEISRIRFVCLVYSKVCIVYSLKAKVMQPHTTKVLRTSCLRVFRLRGFSHLATLQLLWSVLRRPFFLQVGLAPIKREHPAKHLLHFYTSSHRAQSRKP